MPMVLAADKRPGGSCHFLRGTQTVGIRATILITNCMHGRGVMVLCLSLIAVNVKQRQPNWSDATPRTFLKHRTKVALRHNDVGAICL